MSVRTYYAVELSITTGPPVYVELERPVVGYYEAVNNAIRYAVDTLGIEEDTIRCEREVFECGS